MASHRNDRLQQLRQARLKAPTHKDSRDAWNAVVVAGLENRKKAGSTTAA